jgi:glyoxylase-like metal-dependent hydrolase (beta-lactamase superfamily II)
MRGPAAGRAEVRVLHEGYVREDGGVQRVGSTVTLIVDSGHVIVVDPGMVADRGGLLAALRAAGPEPGDVTDIVFSHQPGHTAEDITTLAAAAGDVYACTHAWWMADGPAQDPLATVPQALAASRAAVLAAATVIVPGHGPSFRPGPQTPG